MKKFIALGAGVVTAASIYFAGPASAVPVGPVGQSVCDALPGIDASADSALALAASNKAIADAKVVTERGELDAALAEYIAAVIDHINATDTFGADAALTLALMNAKLAAVGVAGAEWSQAIVDQQTAQSAFDSATLTNDAVDALIAGLCV
jgi:hypothetical protein